MAEETKAQKALHKSKIGGQALIEGVMMKGPLKGAMACRLPGAGLRQLCAVHEGRIPVSDEIRRKAGGGR